MRAGSEIDIDVKIHHATRAKKDGWPLRREARTIGGDENIRAEFIAMRRAKFVQAGRAGFLTSFDEQLDIEAELAAGLDHAAKRADIDGVLALVVGGTAPKQFFTFFDQLPRCQSCAPLLIEPANHIAVTIGKHRG